MMCIKLGGQKKIITLPKNSDVMVDICVDDQHVVTRPRSESNQLAKNFPKFIVCVYVQVNNGDKKL